MESLTKQNRIEWIFLAAMIALCAILTAMQYRWTGEVARAEMERLRANIEVPAQQFCRTFDAELSDACTQLLSAPAEVDAKGREAAHLDRWRKWSAAAARPIFARAAIAVRNGNALELLNSIQPVSGKCGCPILRRNICKLAATGSTTSRSRP